MGRVRDLSEGLWTGRLDPAQHHPFAPMLEREDVGPRTAFVSSVANATAFDTGEGLVLVDTGSFLMKLADRALELAGQGDLPLACHLAEAAWLASPGDVEIAKIRASVYTKRVATEDSLMARGVFRAAAKESGAGES